MRHFCHLIARLWSDLRENLASRVQCLIEPVPDFELSCAPWMIDFALFKSNFSSFSAPLSVPGRICRALWTHGYDPKTFCVATYKASLELPHSQNVFLLSPSSLLLRLVRIKDLC